MTALARLDLCTMYSPEHSLIGCLAIAQFHVCLTVLVSITRKCQNHLRSLISSFATNDGGFFIRICCFLGKSNLQRLNNILILNSNFSILYTIDVNYAIYNSLYLTRWNNSLAYKVFFIVAPIVCWDLVLPLSVGI